MEKPEPGCPPRMRVVERQFLLSIPGCKTRHIGQNEENEIMHQHAVSGSYNPLQG
jgi:hypothetical protein